MLLAVAVTLARPCVLVVADEELRVAVAPEPGATNVTVTPFRALPPESLTVTWRGDPKAVPMVVDWTEPPVAVIDAGGPTVFVREKVAVSVPTLAVTV